MEIWKPVFVKGVACPGYEVSDIGNVRSFRKQTRLKGMKGTVSYVGTTPKILTKIPKSNGYYGVNVVVNGKIKQKTVGVLVLEAFVGPCPEGMNCCHGPLGSFCDLLTNLSWGTASKNHGEDRLRDGTDVRGEKHGAASLTNAQVLEIKKQLQSKKRIGVKLAKKYGVSRSTIVAIKRGVNWAWLKG